MTDILIVEDNSEISNLLQDFLTKAGYQCTQVSCGEEALFYIKHHAVGIVLLDIMLPGIDGFAVCDEIHKSKNLPIIILSARSEKDDKLNGLLLGADDYIEKPYDIDLLTAKVNALYRRYYEKASNHIINSGNLKIDTKSRIVSLGDHTLNLTIKEYDLLLLLLENEGKTLRKDFIFNKVWGFDSCSEPSTLTVHIKWLREKIEKNPKDPRRIITVWGVGYRFEAAYA